MAEPWFHVYEFTCKHCGGGENIIDPDLLTRLGKLRDDWGIPMIVNCGYRCPIHNKDVGGAPDSAHLYGQAADIHDPDGALDAWLTDEMLEAYGLWREEPAATPTWTHLQTRPEKNRTFKP